MEDSKSRKGWMQGPIAAPGGVVVLHATINISRWYCLLPNKICKYNWAEATAQLDKLKDFVLSQRNAVTMLNRARYTKGQWNIFGKEPIYLAYKHTMKAINRKRYEAHKLASENSSFNKESFAPLRADITSFILAIKDLQAPDLDK